MTNNTKARNKPAAAKSHLFVTLEKNEWGWVMGKGSGKLAPSFGHDDEPPAESKRKKHGPRVTLAQCFGFLSVHFAGSLVSQPAAVDPVSCSLQSKVHAGQVGNILQAVAAVTGRIDKAPAIY